ncbi:class I tRNA ligase family protein [Patescibacteria group bacterium]|nr:class I tRNA ligase family protein [Patescibacteria group bacterium]
MSKHFSEFNVGLALIEFEKFFWSDFCDNYLEIVKLKISEPSRFENGELLKRSSQYALYTSMLNILKLIAPVVPHITEEIYQSNYRAFENQTSIHTLTFPTSDHKKDITQELHIKELFDIIDLIRKYKTEHGIKYGQESNTITIFGDEQCIEMLKSFVNEIKSIARSEKVLFEHAEELSVNISF